MSEIMNYYSTRMHFSLFPRQVVILSQESLACINEFCTRALALTYFDGLVANCIFVLNCLNTSKLSHRGLSESSLGYMYAYIDLQKLGRMLKKSSTYTEEKSLL